MDILTENKRISAGYLWAAIAAFCLLFALSYPYYRYYVDPDAVAYLTMARRAAEGDPWRLVNALWSPLHPSLVALCIKAGMPGLLAAQLTNALACILILVAGYRLFRRYAVERFGAVAMLAALSFFLVYALYKQLFCDLWQVAFLLFYLLLITSKGFLRKQGAWVLCALLMALATYTKVYSFYFLLVHFPIALWQIKKSGRSIPFPHRPYILIMLLQLLMLSPLVLLQHHKYGGWGLSKSGAVNTSWLLMGHKTPRADIQALIPPPYSNSPYTWEDPVLAEGRLHSRFESAAMIKSSAAHSIQAALQGIQVMSELSPFLLAVLAGGVLVLLFKKDQQLFGAKDKILIAAACVMPLGYLLQHFEARYIWLLVLPAMIVGLRFLATFRQWSGSGRGYKVAVLLFALSFCAWPVYDLQKLFRAGEDVHQEAVVLRGLGFAGRFTSNDNPSRSGILAYWCDAGFYTPVREKMTLAEVLQDMRRYGVSYYFAYRKPFDVTEPVISDNGRVYPEVSGGRVEGLRVYRILP